MDRPRPARWKRLLKRFTLVAVIGLGAAMLTGFVLQQRSDARFRQTHPAPGSLVVVDGHRMHFRLSGAGDFTFVLESGLGNYSGSWGALESELGKFGRVFTYDRAGLGWSEASPHPRTPRQIAQELHQLLAVARLSPPFILVGHSSGGLSQVRYALEFPGEAAGLLLIDPSHPDQFKRLPPAPVLFTHVLPQLTRTAPFGLPQLLGGSSDPVQNQSSHVATSGAELRALLDNPDASGQTSLALGRTPLYVLTAGDTVIFPGKSGAENHAARTLWHTLHAELVASSASEIRRHIVVEGAQHHLHLTHPAAVVDAAREMIGRIQATTAPAPTTNAR